MVSTLSWPIRAVGAAIIDGSTAAGDITLFARQVIGSAFGRWPRSHVLWPCCYEIGYRSMPVIMVTGVFIGMVLAVQSFDQLRAMRLENRIGSVINISLVKELGPVLAATMLAGRVGSSMAAEIGTMRVTEQIDALKALGADPVRYLVTPRFLGCFLLIPILTVIADALGMLGGWFLSTQVLGVSSYAYWMYSDSYVTAYDIASGLIKRVFFGGALASVACHRGFYCGGGAEGVGKAATEAFVYSFIVIMGIDFVLGVLLMNVQGLFSTVQATLV